MNQYRLLNVKLTRAFYLVNNAGQVYHHKLVLHDANEVQVVKIDSAGVNSGYFLHRFFYYFSPSKVFVHL